MAIVTGKIWTKDEIKALLEKNNGFVLRSLVKIYACQTADEQMSDHTSKNNGIGFNGVDAFIMSRIAKYYMDKGYVSEKQLALVKKKIMKYAKQLASIANEPLTTTV